MGTPNVLADRVLVATTTTGTGTYALGAAVAGYLDPAAAGVAGGARVPYVVVDSLTAPTRMEVGEGVYTAGSPATITRATIRRNTSGGTSAESWPAGTKYLMLAPNAATLPSLETDGTLSAPGLAVTSTTGIASAGAISVSAGNISAQAGEISSRLSGAPTQGILRLGNADKRLWFNGSSFDLDAPLAVAGNVTASGNVVWTSDARTKEDVRPAKVGLEQALRLRAVTFRRKGAGRKARREMGLVAQDVQAAHALAVVRQPDGTLAVSAAAVDALLVEAVRDLAEEVRDLRRRLAAVERRGRA